MIRFLLPVALAAGCSTPNRQSPVQVAVLDASAPAAPDAAAPTAAAEPWDSHDEWAVGWDILVARDAHATRAQLTAYDLATGTQLAHRVFDVGHGVRCEPGSETLLCVIGDGNVLALDGRTLETKLDVGPLIRELAPDSDPAKWEPLDGNLVGIGDAKRGVRVEIDQGTARFLKPPRPQRLVNGRCWSPAPDALPMAGVAWTLEHDGDRSTLHRRKGEQKLAPIALDLAKPRLVGCGSVDYRPHLIANDVVAALGDDGTVTWTSEHLGGAVREIWSSGALVIVPTADPARRVVALDAKTGAIRWTAAADPR